MMQKSLDILGDVNKYVTPQNVAMVGGGALLMLLLGLDPLALLFLILAAYLGYTFVKKVTTENTVSSEAR